MNKIFNMLVMDDEVKKEAKGFLKSLITDDNKINEGNIAVIVGLILLCIDECLVWFDGLTWMEVAFIGIHLIFIFIMCKFEHTQLKADDTIKLANAIAEGVKNR